MSHPLTHIRGNLNDPNIFFLIMQAHAMERENIKINADYKAQDQTP